MITEEIEALFPLAASTAIGTCDKDYNPHFTRVYGAKKGDAADELKIVIPQVTAATCLAHLKEHKLIAYTCNQADNYTLQFKGEVIHINESTAEENALAERAKQRMIDVMINEAGDQFTAPLRRFIVSPGYTITVKVWEIYNQTPGKNAGQKIS